MKILVLSDSHSALRFMRQCVEKLKPDTVIHLGDHYDDAEALEEEYPALRHIRVPGNCDRYRCPPFVREVVCEKVGGRVFCNSANLECCGCGPRLFHIFISLFIIL